MKEPRIVATGLGAPEGPVYLGDGVLVCTEIIGQAITRCADGKAEVVAPTGGGANGATLGADGALYVANNGGIQVGPHGYWFAPDPIDGLIQRVTMDGEVSEVATALPGPAPHRPNDICFGPDGLLYFTDPHNWEDLGNLGPGRICRTDLDGNVELLTEFPMFCNGLGFGPDATLYVAQSMGMKVFAFPWTAAGLGEPREHCTLPAGFPDGFCFSDTGDLYVAGSMGDVLQVLDAEGGLRETMEFPAGSEPTNCCIGDGDLYVTLSGTGDVVAFHLGISPLALYPFRP
jgi:gluconolactonase